MEHLDDALAAHLPFCHSGVEAVPREVVQAVHVKLGRYQVVQKPTRVVVVEDGDCGVEGAAEVFVEPGHDEGREVLVVHAGYDAVFERMAEWAVADVVQQDGHAGRFVFFVRDFDALAAQDVYGFLHEVHGTDGMVKAVMDGAGVDVVGET